MAAAISVRVWAFAIVARQRCAGRDVATRPRIGPARHHDIADGRFYHGKTLVSSLASKRYLEISGHAGRQAIAKLSHDPPLTGKEHVELFADQLDIAQPGYACAFVNR